MNFLMFKMVLEKAEEPEIKLPTSTGSWKKQESSRKTFYFCFIDDAKAFDCVDHNKLWKILKEMFFWNSFGFSMTQRMLAILISGSSAFSKTSLNIWKFTVHLLLKPGLENFEHYFTSVIDFRGRCHLRNTEGIH